MMWSEEHSFLQFFPFWYVCQALGKKSDPLKKKYTNNKTKLCWGRYHKQAKQILFEFLKRCHICTWIIEDTVKVVFNLKEQASSFVI